MAPSGAFFSAALDSPVLRLGGLAGIKEIAIN
jgi:hypothetical protein